MKEEKVLAKPKWERTFPVERGEERGDVRVTQPQLALPGGNGPAWRPWGELETGLSCSSPALHVPLRLE